jgi:hypothetical protein
VKEPPTTIAEKVERKTPDIRSDPQNVHDVAVTIEFSKQFKLLRIYNDDDLQGRARILDDTNEEDRKQICGSLRNIDTTSEKQHNDAAVKEFLEWMERIITDPAIFDELNRRFTNQFFIYDRTDMAERIEEKDVIAAVWRRIHSPQNISRKREMLEALELRLIASIEDGKAVCVTGRAEQFMSALATLDKDTKIGVFKTTALVKGEIFAMGAKIIDKNIDELPEHIKQAYNKSEATTKLNEEDLEILREATVRIKKQIENEITRKYNGKLGIGDIELCIQEMKKTVTID